ncbi:hypothetical protein CDL15_Pgr008007 [Punica granatum]|uniref:Pectinesterase n=1 Tax=Punica granatum TaxID=22663 RepID=A0A218VSV0_PUNGR|nr:hypothetical protein CDL15_Pgr008007 [Punica granatum]
MSMSMMRPSSVSIFFPLFILLSISRLHVTALQEQQPSNDACASTEFPKLCRSMVRSYRTLPSSSDSDLSGLGKHSVKQSLTQAMKMSKVIKHYLSPKRSRSLSRQLLGALRDCSDLSDSTVRFLQSTLSERGEGDLARLTVEEIGRVQTQLSGVVANERLCLNGLKESNSSIARPLSESLSDANQMYGLSLQLMTRALTQNETHHQIRPRVEFEGFVVSSRHRVPLNYLIENIRQGHCNPLKNCPRSGYTSFYFGDSGILINNIVTVGHTGRDHFRSITDAVSSAPHHLRAEDGYYVIYVRRGVYGEYVNIPHNRKHILLLGDGIGQTIITGNRKNDDGWGTYKTASFGVDGDGFIAVDLTFRNTAGLYKGQAVAARVVSDLSTFYRCSFEGYQDTLLSHAGRQFFRECDIYGTIDFIFGFATAAFQNCNIYARKPKPGQATVVTAQGRKYPYETSGFSFHNCTIKPAPDMEKKPRVALNYLGRPWYSYSRTIIMQSYIDKYIHPKGWTPFRGNDGLNTLYYGEYDNRGPGSGTRRRVNWKGYHVLDYQQAQQFTVYNLTTGNTWLPQTDIPHVGGLLG